jgi:hypothetical protein
MRGSGAASALLASLFWLTGCAPPQTDAESGAAALEPPPATALGTERLRINEAVLLGLADGAEPTFEGAVELINVGDAPLAMGRYRLRADVLEWRLPDATLGPGELYVVRAPTVTSGSIETFLGRSVETLALLDDDGLIVDQVAVPASVSGAVLARYPDGVGGPYVYAAERLSLGARNPDTGFVQKLATGTEFAPRDSSPNAIVTHGGYHWVLGGWSHFGGDDWHSYTDVWRSRDGVRWALVNEAPPYIHYSSFVVWQDRIWAIGPVSFSSADGIDWRPESLTSSSLNRSVVLGETLLNVDGPTVRATADGRDWTTLTETAPWGERRQPAVVVHDGKVWVIGGVSEYGGPNQVVYNDVWVSGDGATWTLVNPYADWTPRLWTSGIVYDGKIFVLNGASEIEWPDENGNTAEVWFTEDGVEWFPLESEHKWAARHASLTTLDDAHGLLLLAGYGHGGTARMYNDVWSLRISIFFSKPQGALEDLDTWGKHTDGSGEPPAGFDAPGQLFVLRNRASFSFDESWVVRGAGSRIVVGDGQRTHAVELHVHNRVRPRQPLYLLSNSTTVVSGCAPTVHFKDPRAAYFEHGETCPGGSETLVEGGPSR